METVAVTVNDVWLSHKAYCTTSIRPIVDLTVNLLYFISRRNYVSKCPVLQAHCCHFWFGALCFINTFSLVL